MNLDNKRIIMRYLACVVLCQVAFLIEILYLHDMIIIPNSFFSHRLTYEEWNWYVKQYVGIPHEDKIFFFDDLLKLIFVVVDIIGISRLLFEKNGLLPVGKTAKIAIPIAGVLAYLPFFFYFKYEVEHYQLYMLFVPVEVLTLILLSLILAGLVRSRKMESKPSGE